MKNLLLVASLFAAQHVAAGTVQYTNQVELTTTAEMVQLVDAEYVMVPTKTLTHAIPGCNPNSETGLVCDETIVLESEPVIRANIAFNDRNNQQEGSQPSYTSVDLKITNFSNAQVFALKAASPSWKHPMSTANRDFARNHLALTVVPTVKTIQVVDVRHSQLCQIGESGVPAQGCVEKLVYKNATTTVLVATITQK